MIARQQWSYSLRQPGKSLSVKPDDRPPRAVADSETCVAGRSPRQVRRETPIDQLVKQLAEHRDLVCGHDARGFEVVTSQDKRAVACEVLERPLAPPRGPGWVGRVDLPRDIRDQSRVSQDKGAGH